MAGVGELSSSTPAPESPQSPQWKILDAVNEEPDSDDGDDNLEPPPKPHLSAEAANAMLEAAWARATASQQAVHAAVQQSIRAAPPLLPPPEVAMMTISDPTSEVLLRPQTPRTANIASRLPAEMRPRLTRASLTDTQTQPTANDIPFVLPWRGLRDAVHQPPWPAGATMCGRVRRIRAPSTSSSSDAPGALLRFELSLELPHTPHELLLLAARKLVRSLTPYYAISLDANDVARDSPSYMGKLRASSVGASNWVLFDHGLPKRHLKHLGPESTQHARAQLLSVRFTSADAGPPGINAVVMDTGGDDNASAEAGAPTVAPSTSNGDDSRRLRGFELRSKPAIWDESRSAFTLEYNGRASMASIKNVQLISTAQPPAADDPHPPSAAGREEPIFQMGKMSDDEFAVDWRAPLSAMSAFGLALSICDAKPSHAVSVKRLGSAMRWSRPSSAAGSGAGSGRWGALGGNAMARVVPHDSKKDLLEGLEQPVADSERGGGRADGDEDSGSPAPAPVVAPIS